MGPEFLGALKLVLAVQASQAALAGTIRDGESGMPLAGAVVALTDLDREAVSDSLGRYRLSAVPSGPQHLSVKRIGYSPRTMHALFPSQGELKIDLSLNPAPVQLPTLVVRSRVAVRGLETGEATSYPDRSISAAALRNHPLLAEPDGFLGLSGGEIAVTPEAPSGIHVRGGASDQTAYLLDGVPVFSPYHAAGTFSAWNPDALDRLQVLSGSPS
ncbi:MAG: carboxypeptidase-like regulatory domain-containing protein, partial [Gemmatimonadales bacterium]|nr:carboxypeptidase-like regulatory domain-containing protein [Gemmatimonadales bacterium]